MTQRIKTEEITEKELLSLITDFEEKGGVLDFNVLRLKRQTEEKDSGNDYENHMIVARQTLEKIHYRANRYNNSIAPKGERTSFPMFTTDFDTLDSSGRRNSIQEFLGPFYDIKLNKPLIRGCLDNTTVGKYFYYDSPEELLHAKDEHDPDLDFSSKYPEAKDTRGFIYSFMEPPYGLVRIGDSIKEKGQYLIRFMQYLFSEIEDLHVYSWSIDSSKYFDAGKEWWGASFWTVYNSEKDWYIGICGSSTDY